MNSLALTPTLDLRSLHRQAIFMRIMGVNYVHVKTNDDGDLYVTPYGVPFFQHLMPENWYETAPDGSPLRKPSQGAYAVVEGDLLPEGGARQVTAFLRAGLSDPHTTPFHGGFQAGLLMAPALSSRPDSQVSLGTHHAWTSNHFRDAMRAEGGNPGNETVVELTYSDQIAPWLALQPDVQWVHQPGGDRDVPDAVVGIVRLTWSF